MYIKGDQQIKKNLHTLKETNTWDICWSLLKQPMYLNQRPTKKTDVNQQETFKRELSKESCIHQNRDMQKRPANIPKITSKETYIHQLETNHKH